MRRSGGAPTVQRVAWLMAAEHGVEAAEARGHADVLGKTGAFAEPHVCLHCRYRTTEPAWRCPHCHRWDTFVPEV